MKIYPVLIFCSFIVQQKEGISKWTTKKLLSLVNWDIHVYHFGLFVCNRLNFNLNGCLDGVFLLNDKQFFSASEIQHLFYSKENDWGYSNFIVWNVSISSAWFTFVRNKRLYIHVHVCTSQKHSVQIHVFLKEINKGRKQYQKFLVLVTMNS